MSTDTNTMLIVLFIRNRWYRRKHVSVASAKNFLVPRIKQFPPSESGLRQARTWWKNLDAAERESLQKSYSLA